MGERRWTPNQQSAIDTRDRTLLVSAAAGSGKTATLTERIIRSLLDEKNPIGIEDMLIVTYTRAAVGELKERIGKAVKKAIKERPGDSRLERQLHMLPSAKICTIDSFCADILRANAERVGISPGFRIPDAAEAQLLGENILDALIGAVFEGKAMGVASPKEIDELTDCLAQTRKQSELPAIIRMIYESTLTALDGVDAIGALVEEFNPDKFVSVEKTRFGGYCMDRLSEMLSHYEIVFSDIKRELESIGNKKHVKILVMIENALNLISSLSTAKTYTEARALLMSVEFERAAPVPKDEPLPPIKVIRSRFKDDVLRMGKEFFVYPEEDWKIAYKGLYKQFGVLYRVVKEFDRLFKQEKQRRGMCEFSDIERYTYECLWQNGEKTDIALAQSKLYKAVYIDEYQDVNSLQNKIFEAISSESNRFMVGDIKQSIYEFRSANPQIFANMKKSYPTLGSVGDYPEASIFMSDNFRCDKGVIDFVNDVFDKLFYHLRNSIGYVEEDRLNYSKVYDHPEPEYRYPEICLCNTFADSDPRSEIMKDADLVPAVVAAKIRELLDDGYLDNGEKIQPKHIAIIMRKVKSKADKYSKALKELGIPSAVAESERFFINADVMLVLCLLNSIDNPRKDIYLAGLMCSPIYGFSLGDVAVIRKTAPASTLYDSLKLYATMDEADPRVEKFLEKLSYYRLISEGLPTDKLLMKLYHETGLLALAASGADGKDNLMLLYEHARKFESSSFGGLYNFISYINQLTGRNNEFDKREAPGECDAVRIITAHGSKGLEYPIVFFAGGEASFKQSVSVGEAPRFEYEEGFGMGMLLRTPSGLALVNNSTKNIIKDYRHRKKIEEEARVLYVILTRARERLYVVGQIPSKTEDFEEETAASREYMSTYGAYRIGSMLKMILEMKSFEVKTPREFLKTPPYVYSKEAEKSVVNGVNLEEYRNTEEMDLEPIETVDDVVASHYEALMRKRFSFVYPDKHLSNLPEKLSVSRLYPEILDGANEFSMLLEDEDEEENVAILPKFRSGNDFKESAKRGIATHMLLQFCDFELLAKNGAKSELERLKSLNFLSEKDASLVRVFEAQKFADSALMSEIKKAKKIYREQRFNVKLPAEDFTTVPELKKLYTGEYLLVQGVIDCLYEDENGDLHLIDYKTDRLTKEERENSALAQKKMKEKHATQLSYYAKAVEILFGKYPKTVEVYSLHLGDTVDVSDNGTDK